MNKSLSPAITAVIIVIVVALLSVWGYRMMQPAPYTPSPGVAGRPAAQVPNYGTPGQSGAPAGAPSNTSPVVPPAGATPGMPPGYSGAPK